MNFDKLRVFERQWGLARPTYPMTSNQWLYWIALKNVPRYARPATFKRYAEREAAVDFETSNQKQWRTKGYYNYINNWYKGNIPKYGKLLLAKSKANLQRRPTNPRTQARVSEWKARFQRKMAKAATISAAAYRAKSRYWGKK